MPNLRSQSITPDGISLVASDGRSIVLTRADVLAHFQSLNGDRPSKIAATIQWVKQQIETAFTLDNNEYDPVTGALVLAHPPSSLVLNALIDFDFDDVAGMKSLGVRSQ